MGIGTLGGGDFFQVGLENYSEYESSQANKKKKIPIVISRISHFWSPTLTNFSYFVFVSLFSMVYTPPTH